MDRDQLEGWLRDGLSLGQMGSLAGRHPSTISYWLKQYGLTAIGHAKHRPKGALTPGELIPLIEDGLTIEEIGGKLNRSARTIKYWIDRLGLPKPRDRRRGATAEELAAAPDRRILKCREHGETLFIRRPDGYWRCKRCRVEAVTNRRRNVKRILVAEAGGCCAICGYDRTPAALQFHHLDPSAKKFALSLQGSTKAIASLRQEARKCVLLCANCHVEVEQGVASLPTAVGESSPDPG